MTSVTKPLPRRQTPIQSAPVPKLFSPLRKTKAEIKKSAQPPKGNGTPNIARKVGLKPGDGWHRRNFFTEVLIPSLFAKCAGERNSPIFPELKANEVGVTWIGHASFLIQMDGNSLLIDANWAT